MSEGEVESVEPLSKAQNGTVFWWLVTLRGRPEEFALHQNWFALFGELGPGDKVTYEISRAKLSYDGSQGVDKEGYAMFNKLRKIEDEKEWGEVEPEI